MNEIIKKENYKGYEIYVMKVNTDLPIYYDLTNANVYYNGYIVIPEDSKFYNKSYTFINNEIDVHGGFTFSDFVDGKFTIGFDTAHEFDNMYTQNKKFVLRELRKAVDQFKEVK